MECNKMHLTATIPDIIPTNSGLDAYPKELLIGVNALNINTTNIVDVKAILNNVVAYTRIGRVISFLLIKTEKTGLHSISKYNH